MGEYISPQDALQNMLRDLDSGRICLSTGPMEIKPWTEQEKADLEKALRQMFEKEKKLGFITEEGEWSEKALNYYQKVDK